jgi:hypothetical protein
VKARTSFDGGHLALVIGAVFLALLLGVAGALVGYVGQIFFLTLLVPALLLLVDYRFGVILLILMMPFANSPLIPQAGPLNIINLLLAGVCMLFVVRMVVLKVGNKPALLPVPKDLLWFYILPMTLATVVGTTHLSEIPAHYLMANKIEAYGIKQYWISQYLKQMLMVFMACVMAAGVVEYGKGMRFAVSTFVAGMLFVLLMAVMIALSGMSLDRLKDSRTFLTLLGRHNNEASVMLLGVFGPMLFMRSHVRSAMGRFWLGIGIAATGIGVVLTFSRGGFLGLLVVCAIYVFHFRRLRTVVVALVVVVLAAVLAPEAVYERMSRGLDESTSNVDTKGDELTAGRGYTWKQLAPEILKSPLWGRGLQSTQWSTHVKTSTYNANHPHNLYLEILMDLGLLGAAAMFFFYRYVWRTFRALARSEHVPPPMRGYFMGAFAGFVGMLVYGISNGHAYPAPEQIFFWVAVGLAAGYSGRGASGVGEPATVPGRRGLRGPVVAKTRSAGWRAA